MLLTVRITYGGSCLLSIAKRSPLQRRGGHNEGLSELDKHGDGVRMSGVAKDE